VGFLAFVVLYKLGDAFSLSLVTPFLLQAMHFSIAEVGVVNKVIGLWLTIGGALLGGALMLRIGLWRALMYFGIFQMLGILCFWWLAVNGRGALPGLTIPAFDWGFVKLAQATEVDGGLLFAVAGENLSGGMGTAAFLAFLMSLCNQRFTRRSSRCSARSRRSGGSGSGRSRVCWPSRSAGRPSSSSRR